MTSAPRLGKPPSRVDAGGGRGELQADRGPVEGKSAGAVPPRPRRHPRRGAWVRPRRPARARFASTLVGTQVAQTVLLVTSVYSNCRLCVPEHVARQAFLPHQLPSGTRDLDIAC